MSCPVLTTSSQWRRLLTSTTSASWSLRGSRRSTATPPGDLLRDREGGVSVRVAERLGCSLLAFADLPAVDDQVVRVGHAVDPHGTERVLLESHACFAPPGIVLLAAGMPRLTAIPPRPS